MKKTPFCIVLAAFILIISASHAFASNGVTWIDPTYNPTGLLAGFYGYSQDEYMNHVTEYDSNWGRALNHGGEIKGYDIGEVGVYFTNVYEQKLSDTGLAYSLVSESMYTMNYGDADVEAIMEAINDSRVWLMGTETYGWGECEYGVMSEYEYYLFRIEQNGESTAFLAECYSNYEGGEGVEIKLFSTRTRDEATAEKDHTRRGETASTEGMANAVVTELGNAIDWAEFSLRSITTQVDEDEYEPGFTIDFYGLITGEINVYGGFRNDNWKTDMVSVYVNNPSSDIESAVANLYGSTLYILFGIDRYSAEEEIREELLYNPSWDGITLSLENGVSVYLGIYPDGEWFSQMQVAR